MEFEKPLYLIDKAIDVLKNASTPFATKGSSIQKDNYRHLWARNSAVSGLAITSNNITELTGPFKSSLMLLQKAASKHEQIPSTITLTKFKQTPKNRLNRNLEASTKFIERVLQKESDIISQHKTLVYLEVGSRFVIVKNNLSTAN
jgi:hypothetical protein